MESILDKNLKLKPPLLSSTSPHPPMFLANIQCCFFQSVTSQSNVPALGFKLLGRTGQYSCVNMCDPISACRSILIHIVVTFRSSQFPFSSFLIINGRLFLTIAFDRFLRRRRNHPNHKRVESYWQSSWYSLYSFL